MKKSVFVTLILISLACYGWVVSKGRTISGTVTDEKGFAIPGVSVGAAGSQAQTLTNAQGRYAIVVADTVKSLSFSYIGYQSQTVKIGKKAIINVSMKAGYGVLNEVVVTAHAAPRSKQLVGSASVNAAYTYSPGRMIIQDENTESYRGITENGFHIASNDPLSTFSVDVDAASYSNVRRFINGGQMPPADAVRIEEMINYFNYNLPGPTNNDPVAIHTELTSAP